MESSFELIACHLLQKLESVKEEKEHQKQLKENPGMISSLMRSGAGSVLQEPRGCCNR